MSFLPAPGPLAACWKTLRQLTPVTTKRYKSLMQINSRSTRPHLFHSPNADTPRRRIKIFPPIAAPKTKDAVGDLTAVQLATLDPAGARTKLFSRANKEAIRPGDIVQVRRTNDEPFAGVLLNVRRRGVDTAILLRNQLTRVGVEMWFKVYSPVIDGIDLVQRSVRRIRRAKLYYMRKPEHDMGSVQNIVSQYTRQRALLRGEAAPAKGKGKGKKRR